MRLEATELTEAELELQQEVREFLAERLPAGSYPIGLGVPGAVDPEFSKALGARGWLGMALPREYGGGGRSAVERLIVAEELLAVGAPVGYHWIGDRQSGHSIAASGTEAQKRALLPGIVSGELSFGIGMSEPSAGSDLAGLRTRARPVEGGWSVTGTKIWTTGALHATHFLALFRTADERHGGLTQFIVERDLPGLTIAAIPFIDGTEDFCELTFDEVFIPDEMRLGEIGAGWGQNIAELALERGGVDRWMSMVPVLDHWSRGGFGPLSEAAREDLGLIVARMWGLRGISLSIARAVDEGRTPSIEAALAKEMATRFEQDCVEVVSRHFGRTPDPSSDDPYEQLLARAILVSPSWSIRGGTIEILRNIVSKGLGIA
ncbi:acyl-CoA dehydrogenase family protein [Microbacterium sp. X-17]|uniref:acyl-CoA dehydrogenase family protein n=1 Tax=Microbacterium sp. X-17 TaxID=3144404 RepID=UPI0031F49491